MKTSYRVVDRIKSNKNYRKVIKEVKDTKAKNKGKYVNRK